MGSDAIKKAKQPAHQKTVQSRLVTNMYSIGWIAGFFIFSYLIDFLSILGRIKHDTYFWLAAGSIGGFTLCFIYLSVYLPKVKGFKVNFDKWEEEVSKIKQLAILKPTYLKKKYNLLTQKAFEEKQKQPVVLILGSSDSGKSTLLKQLKIIHGNGFTNEEKEGYKHLVWENIAIYCKKILSQFANIKDIADKYAKLGTLTKETVTGKDVAGLILDLYNETIVIDTILFIKDLPGTASLIPTENITDTVFTIDRQQMHFIDVNGNPRHRKYWLPYFDNANAVVFVASLASYDMMVEDDVETNQMADSIFLLQSLVSHPLLSKPNFIVFLNKSDLFEIKVKLVDVKKHFPDFKGNICL
ncbi:Guanine nucleotide-binding protein subunit alpha-15 [Boothiomyces sp. JEL0866]|nr:Guanine nucleotide-binding protein subunit alpha-15 [Boothiomyces sp. JEL0866]